MLGREIHIENNFFFSSPLTLASWLVLATKSQNCSNYAALFITLILGPVLFKNPGKRGPWKGHLYLKLSR